MAPTTNMKASSKPYSINPMPNGVQLPPLDARQYRLTYNPEVPPPRRFLGLGKDKKPAYPCPFCLEPIPPEYLDPDRHYLVCSVCKRWILAELLRFPLTHYGRYEDMAHLCLEAVFIRHWQWVLMRNYKRLTDGGRDEDYRQGKGEFEALVAGVSFLLEQQTLFVMKEGEVDVLVYAFLENPPGRFGTLGRDMRAGREYRERARELLLSRAPLSAFTNFQIDLVTATSWGAYGEREKDEVLARLRERL
jgi:hypothetical protein